LLWCPDYRIVEWAFRRRDAAINLDFLLGLLGRYWGFNASVPQLEPDDDIASLVKLK
jgi:hypothetical protein